MCLFYITLIPEEPTQELGGLLRVILIYLVFSYLSAQPSNFSLHSFMMAAAPPNVHCEFLSNFSCFRS